MDFSFDLAIRDLLRLVWLCAIFFAFFCTFLLFFRVISYHDYKPRSQQMTRPRARQGQGHALCVLDINNS